MTEEAKKEEAKHEEPTVMATSAVASSPAVADAPRRYSAFGTFAALTQLRRRVVAGRASGTFFPPTPKPSGTAFRRGLTKTLAASTAGDGEREAEGQVYYEMAMQTVEHGHTISRLMEEKKVASIKHEEVDVVHRIDNEEHPGIEYDIPEDSYGAAVLAIVKEVQEFGPSGRTSARLRGGFALVLLTVNLMLQVGILMFIDSHVVQPAVHQIQSIFKEYHATVFDTSGRFRPERWAAYAGKQKICQMGAASRFFYGVVLFVWVTAMLGEFRTTYYLWRNITRMPRCTHEGKMLVATSENVCIVALTLTTKLLLCTVVCIPKFLISTYLLALGCQWLSASTSFEALVLNSVAMEFVLHIDELLYRAFVPATYRRQVADIDFFVRKPRSSDEDEDTKAWMSYGWSLAYFVGALSFTFFYMFFLEDALPPDISDVQVHCAEYVEKIGSMLCAGWGWTEEARACYPYGNASQLVASQRGLPMGAGRIA